MGQPRAPRYASLDLWRGVACLMVLVNHGVSFRGVATPSDGVMQHLNVVIEVVAKRMWIGVPIFFVISGYCITAALDGHRRKGRSVADYFLRRFRRIFPPYWAALISTAVLAGVLDVLFSGAVSRNGLFRPWWFSASQWFGSLTLTEIWRAHIFGSPKALYLGQAWTLCYEEQFYAVSGALLLLCPKRLFTGAAAVTGAVALLAVAAPRLNLPIDGYFFDGNWLQFSLGILLYYVLNYGGVLARRLAAATFVLVMVAAASYGSALLEPEKNQAQVYLIAGAFSLIALWVQRFDARLMAAPRLGPLRSCGLMCYSLYLVHMPIAMFILAGFRAAGIAPETLSPFISLPVCGIPALWLAWQFHLSVERRFMRAPAADLPPVRAEQLAMA